LSHFFKPSQQRFLTFSPPPADLAKLQRYSSSCAFCHSNAPDAGFLPLRTPDAASPALARQFPFELADALPVGLLLRLEPQIVLAIPIVGRLACASPLLQLLRIQPLLAAVLGKLGLVECGALDHSIELVARAPAFGAGFAIGYQQAKLTRFPAPVVQRGFAMPSSLAIFTMDRLCGAIIFCSTASFRSFGYRMINPPSPPVCSIIEGIESCDNQPDKGGLPDGFSFLNRMDAQGLLE